MSPIKLFIVVAAGALLAACESGDINISPVNNTDNSIGDNNSIGSGGGGSNDGCASIDVGGSTISGIKDALGNCEYDDQFTSPTNKISQNITFPALPGGAAHKFRTSLFIGETYTTQADLDAAGITQGGDGPTLTIEAGAILAFETKRDFIIINRGSQIIADGTSRSPIVFTSISDVEGTLPTTPTDPAGARAVQQWGGIVINGFGVSNKCSYDGNRGDAGFQLTPGTECSIEAEGSEGDDESQYGGDNDADSSGILRYVVVKHTGAQVANGDELNGISFGGVGNGTVIENLQVYSTYDDGIEFFGGSANVTNFVAVNVRDDSIDIDEGYNGTITNALVIQQVDDGDHCIEADGIGSYSSFPNDAAGTAAKQAIIAAGLNSRPTINGLTCIVSANAGGTHSDGAGWRFREGIWPTVRNSQIISSFAVDEAGGVDNYCLRVDDSETQDAAANGDMSITGSVFSCQTPAYGNAIGGFADEQAWAESLGNQFAAVAPGTAKNPTVQIDTDLALLEGNQPVFSLDVGSTLIDGSAPTAAPVDDGNGVPTYFGGIQGANDWTFPWAYGINPSNRGEPLWFE